MSRFLLLGVLISGFGCPSSGIRGETPFWQETKFTLNTQHTCLPDPEVIRIADLAYAAIVQACIEAGLIKDLEEAKSRTGKPGVCLIPKPETCKVSGNCAQGSKGPDCTPKAGCSSDFGGWLWIAAEGLDGKPQDWGALLVHEAGHVLAPKFRSYTKADHTGPWESIEARALVIFTKLRGH